MLLLKLLEESDSEVVYSYFPEKKKYFGTVKINKITGEIIDVQTADNDLHKGTCIMQYLKLSVFVKKVIFQKKRWFLGIECKR